MVENNVKDEEDSSVACYKIRMTQDLLTAGGFFSFTEPQTYSQSNFSCHKML